ncbi:tripartite tricarboxylate transporter substrate binding protein [Caproiciproducens sp. NJN-50]|uniref:tripartite tricarboxylate transporter substrate binding protein n=1 Tax=Acutalibacteraceae TaxID=3082771 RepID=UPI000FFE330D|nr:MULTISPECIES: tripartite tricarboxylate transporter substrate binding protein [Acutalibacteraceae]QAT48742.1 tripartite tricarboxylate transporter substrate binding protein [Caproiciproducens sp. NJN-50]
MNKKILSFVAAAAVAIGAMTGCSGNGAASTGTSSAAKAGSAWPAKPVSIYVPAKAGAGTDMHARILAQYIQKKTGKSVTIVNQPDGSGTVAFESVRNAKPDGNTLLFYHSNLVAAYWTGTYDHTYEDFTNVCITTDNGSQAFVAAPDAPYKDLKELVEYAQKNPGGVKTGVQLGGGSHITMATFENEAGISLKLVEAGSNADKLTAMAGKQLDFTVQDLLTAIQYEKAGKMKILAVGTKDENYPQYKTCEEEGYPEIGQRTYYMLHGPKGMDQSVVDAINDYVKSFAEDPESQKATEKIGGTLHYGNQEETKAWLKSESERYDKATAAIGTNTRHK